VEGEQTLPHTLRAALRGSLGVAFLGHLHLMVPLCLCLCCLLLYHLALQLAPLSLGGLERLCTYRGARAGPAPDHWCILRALVARRASAP
jgi:hypothetical protein